MIRQNLNTFLRNYYLANSFYDFVFAYAIYNIFFSIRGLSVFQISLLLAWWALIAIIFEIPSGALADAWSRKKMLTIAPLIKTLCFVTWFFANGNFYLYALGFAFWALGSAFMSGTTEALLYDTLVFHNQKDQYEKILSRKKFYFHIALALSTISGGFIAQYHIEWAIVFSVIPLLFSALFASFLKDAPKVESTGEVHYIEYLRLAYNEIKTNKILLYLFFFLLGVAIMWELEEFDQLYYQLARLPIFAFGLIGAVWSSLSALASNYAYRLKNKICAYYFLPFMAGILLLFVGLRPSIPMIGLLLIAYFLVSPLRVLGESKIQHNIKSISRATVTSASTLVIYLSHALIAVFYGLISKFWGLQNIYVITGIFLVIFAGWVLRNKKSIVSQQIV